MPRKHARTAVSLNIILEWSSGKREARLSDISLSGCFIDSLTPINKGELVSFKIKISDKELLNFNGEIVYVFPGVGFGVRFISLSENDQAILEHLILMNNGDPWRKD